MLMYEPNGGFFGVTIPNSDYLYVKVDFVSADYDQSQITVLLV